MPDDFLAKLNRGDLDVLAAIFAEALQRTHRRVSQDSPLDPAVFRQETIHVVMLRFAHLPNHEFWQDYVDYISGLQNLIDSSFTS